MAMAMPMAMASTSDSTAATTQVQGDTIMSTSVSDFNQTAKRKRASTEPRSLQRTATSLHPPRDVQQQINDYVQVLKSFDVNNNILTRPFSAHESAEEPHAKRKKAEAEVDSISHRASSGIYSSLNHVIADVKDVCSSLLEELQPTEASRSSYDYLAAQKEEKLSLVRLFRKKAGEILEQEKARDASRALGRSSKLPEANGANHPSTKSVTQLTAKPEDNATALTLFATMPNDTRPLAKNGPKQLFSSLQKSMITEDGKRVTHVLREAALPYAVTSTQIFPLESTGLVDNKKTAQSLGDLYSSSTATLPVHKSSRVGTTKSNVVGWYQPNSMEGARSKNDHSYSGQRIACGQWLDYNGQYSQRKRKQKDRSLSLTGVQLAGETEQDRVEALLKNAYSSFAPSRDDTAAVVSQETLNRMWWQKRGEKSFERLVSNSENVVAILDPVDSADPDGLESNSKIEVDDEFKDVIDAVNAAVIDPDLEEVSYKTIEEKEAEEVLEEISELLETLNSYQRNRHIGPVTSKLNDSVTPKKPDEIEIATYGTLKSQLAFMIAMLPPFAVAKLNSDQLSELSISTKIPVLKENYKGVMDEDPDTQRIKAAEHAESLAAQRASSRVATPSSSRPSTSALYGNQYSARPAAATSYYSQTPVRPPVSRVPATAQSYRPQPPPSYRGTAPQTYPTAAYPHQIPRQPVSQYSSSSQYYQTPTAQSYSQPNYSNPPMSAPQPAPNGRYAAPSTNYQSRPPPQSTMVYPPYPNGSPAPRPQIPPKHSYSPQPTGTQPNRSYGTPTPNNAPARDYYAPPTVPNGNLPSLSQPQATQAVGLTGYATVMSAAEQNNMMERQRAHIAQQQGSQLQARNAAQPGPVHGSPSPVVNGGSAVPASSN